MRKKKKDPAAQAMAKKRWAKTTVKQRSEVGKRLNEVRWGAKAGDEKPAAAEATKK